MADELTPDDLLNIRVAKALGWKVTTDFDGYHEVWQVIDEKLYKHGYKSYEGEEQALLGNYSTWAQNLDDAVALVFDDNPWGASLSRRHFGAILCKQHGITARQLVRTWLAWKEQITTD